MLEKGNVSKEEYRKLVNKGRKWFSDYLYMMAEGALSEPEKSRLIGVSCDLFRSSMQNDEEFFRSVEDFVTKRRCAKEKNAYFRTIMSSMVKSGEIKRRYFEKYPED